MSDYRTIDQLKGKVKVTFPDYCDMVRGIFGDSLRFDFNTMMTIYVEWMSMGCQKLDRERFDAVDTMCDKHGTLTRTQVCIHDANREIISHICDECINEGS